MVRDEVCPGSSDEECGNKVTEVCEECGVSTCNEHSWLNLSKKFNSLCDKCLNLREEE